ncbi:MAG: hypothetical protein IPM79_37785 [Polyangiaceae bacterium]|nr:hypothetical protein [Polyangiaceae bacterium]
MPTVALETTTRSPVSTSTRMTVVSRSISHSAVPSADAVKARIPTGCGPLPTDSAPATPESTVRSPVARSTRTKAAPENPTKASVVTSTYVEKPSPGKPPPTPRV